MKRMLKFLPIALLLLSPSIFAKDIAVLLPVVGPLTPYEKSELTKEVVAGLAGKFELKHGEDVDLVVKQAFQEESKKKDCDETNCYRKIAAKFHAEKIVAIRVVLVENERYLVTYSLYDVAAGEMADSQKRECAGCSFEKIKVICNELLSQ